MKIKLAEGLLRRKELQMKVDQLQKVKEDHLFEMKFERKHISDSIDDIRAMVPVVEMNQVTAEYDYYAKRLRKIDAVIQQANWTAEIAPEDVVMQDYKSEK